MPDLTERVPQNSTSKPIPLSRKTSVPVKSPNEDASSPSKIPVKRKIREAFNPEASLQLDQSGAVPEHSALSSPDGETNKNVKTNANFEVHSLKEMEAEQEQILDKAQFMSLKKFWEKSAESSGNAHSHAEQDVSDMRSLQQLPAKPSRSIPIPSIIKSNNGERSNPEYTHRIKHLPQRIPLASSSEDEMVHVPPPRKSSSFLPRSTYAKSKGSSPSKSLSSESNGVISHSEDSSGTSRSSKKSKLPVRASQAVKEPKGDPNAAEDKLPNVSEPAIPGLLEDVIVPETKPKVQESLYSKVQILIDTVSSDEEHGRTEAKPKNEDRMVHTSQEPENGINILHTFYVVDIAVITKWERNLNGAVFALLRCLVLFSELINR